MIKNNREKPCLFTIGHSDHEMSKLLSLLMRYEVNVIADVRSHPYSRYHDQFNKEMLKEQLKRANIRYVFLGRELGARRSERESYRENQARYDLISQLPKFREGLERLRHGLLSNRIALLCAEKDPITCHRTVLVCRHLRSESIDIRHILADGSLETTEQVEMRLLEAVHLPTTHLFYNQAELIEQAYDLQSERIAYTESQLPQVVSGESA